MAANRRITVQEFAAALVAAGVITEQDRDRTRHIVIDADVDKGYVSLYMERYGDARVLDVTVTLAGIQVIDPNAVRAPGTDRSLRRGHLADLAAADPDRFATTMRALWPDGPNAPENNQTAAAVWSAWEAADDVERHCGYWLVGRDWYRRLRVLSGDTTDPASWVISDEDLFLGRPVHVDDSDTARGLALVADLTTS